jgi:glycogen debranching enzyme
MTIGESTPEHELATTHSSLHNMRVLKHKDMFGIFHVSGDIPADPDTAAGLFSKDMRVLSRWRLVILGTRLKFLSGGFDRNGLVMTSHLANFGFTDRNGTWVPENSLSLHRAKFIFNETLYERFSLANHGIEPVSIQTALRFGSDFKDIFEVRGLQRSRRGTQFDTAYDADSCKITYTGLDGQARYCQIRFSRRPEIMTLNEATFSLPLEPKQQWEMVCRVSALDEDMPEHDYAMAQGGATEDLEAKYRTWLTIRTDNELFNSWLDASCRAVSVLVTELPTGPYPYAGIPWFSVPFGRDGIITALQVINFNPGIAKGVLLYLADNQATEYIDFRDAEPGRILHETRQGEAACTGEVPFQKYYGSVDSTPLFIFLAAAYCKATNDIEFVKALMPSLQAALQWLEKDGDKDGDGFIEYLRHSDKGLTTQGWKDSFDSVFHEDGTLAEPPIALCEVQGYAYAAYRDMAFLNEVMGNHDEKARLQEKSDSLFRRFNETFWDEALDCYVMALDSGKKPCRVKASNVGHLLFSGIVPEDRARKIVNLLMSPEFFSGWGIRTVGINEARYSPLSYHNGSVWPHDTSIIASGFARYGYHREALHILQALFLTAQHVERMLLPELICGFNKTMDNGVVFYPTACQPQAWSSAAVFMTLSAALGLSTENGKISATQPDYQEFPFQRLELWRGNTKIFPAG